MPTIHNHKKFLEEFDPTNIDKLMVRKTFDFSEFSDGMRDLFRAEAYSRKHKTYTNINILNGYKPQTHLYRYVTYRHFIDYASNNYLTFVSPQQWQDPFERRFLKTDYTKYNYAQPDIFCMCTTENGIENEDAAWRLYGNSQDKTLRIKINVDKLLKALNDFSSQTGFNIYIGKMIYEFSRTDIEKIHTEENDFFHKQFFYEPFTDNNYLSLMCLKQNAYKYENEVRFFCCKPSDDFSNDLFINIPINITDVIEEVVVGPIYPFSMQDPRSTYFSDYNDLDFKAFSNSISNILPTTPIIQSSINIINQLDIV